MRKVITLAALMMAGSALAEMAGNIYYQASFTTNYFQQTCTANRQHMIANPWPVRWSYGDLTPIVEDPTTISGKIMCNYHMDDRPEEDGRIHIMGVWWAPGTVDGTEDLPFGYWGDENGDPFDQEEFTHCPVGGGLWLNNASSEDIVLQWRNRFVNVFDNVED